MIPAALLALAVTSTAPTRPDPCAGAPLACRATTRNAIATWRTTAEVRLAALRACHRELDARSSTDALALADTSGTGSATPAPGYSGTALLAAYLGGTATVAVLVALFELLVHR